MVVCGSPGEVASDFSLDTAGAYDPMTYISKLYNREIHREKGVVYQKGSVWTNIVLNAPDQLRQRMAWALYQILPVGPPGTNLRKTEIFLSYYDIFVRNALGNYRDILKEISFKEEMARWLTFIDNKSLQYEWDNPLGPEPALVLPDENYARE